MGPLRVERLLAFARELQRASTFHELLAATRREIEVTLGYREAWLFVGDHEEPEEVRLIASSGVGGPGHGVEVPRLTIRGDAMLEEIVRGDRPVVVADARTDPRTDKAIVERLGNRTIVNIPLRLLDKPFGAFGTGTFGDEGCRPPSAEQLDYLLGMASQLSVAASRIGYLEERATAEAERRELERRLAQAQMMESLGLMAGGVAHDFNNLLTVILTGASLARMLPAEARGEGGLDAIIEAAHRGRALTKQLLAMSRSQPLELVPTDLNERLRAFLALARRVIPETIRIDFAQGAPLPKIPADVSQLDQVFLNLCLNARDAMPEGGRLTVRTATLVVDAANARRYPEAKLGRHVMTTVTDTGAGMSPDVIARIFEPFFTTKKDRGGTGLGLAVSHSIVARHGGLLQCRSESGAGTTFEILLPAPEEVPSAPDRPSVESARGGSERVLVAEDEAAVRAAIGHVLTTSGYDVTLVEDGAAACEAACRIPFDLVLLDLVMPTMGAREALPRIRALLPRARFIIASGYRTGAIESIGGEDALLLPKPFDSGGLLRAVRKALDAPFGASSPALDRPRVRPPIR